MPTSLTTPVVLLLAAVGVVVLLTATGRHHRGAILAAFLCGAIFAGVTGCGSSLEHATGTVTAPAADTAAAPR